MPAGGRVKRAADGRIDLLSPIACPFNYGCLPELPSADGEPADAVILGPRLPRGAEGTGALWLRVRFVDQGLPDDKWVVGDRPPTAAELRNILRFFRTYARIKRWFGRDAAYLGTVPT